MRKLLAITLLLLAAGSTKAAAQDHDNNELGVIIGRTFISDQGVPNTNFFDNVVRFGKGLTFEGNYSRGLIDFRWAGGATLSVEVPVIYNPDEDIHYPLNIIPQQYSSVFVTPAARLNVLRGYAFSPWISFGGGIGHYVASDNLLFGGKNPGHRVKTTGALQGGVGFDVPIPGVHFMKFRFAARDTWAGVPPINVNTGKTRQHNYFVGGGAVFHF
jgi:hypothetical protein